MPHRVDGVLQLCQPVRHGLSSVTPAAAVPEARARGERAPPGGREERFGGTGENPPAAGVGRPRHGCPGRRWSHRPSRVFKERLDLALSVMVCFGAAVFSHRLNLMVSEVYSYLSDSATAWAAFAVQQSL